MAGSGMDLAGLPCFILQTRPLLELKATPASARVALTILEKLISYDKEAMPMYSRPQ